MKTIFVLIILFFIASIGRLVNSYTIEKIAEQKILKDAEVEFIKFEKSYDPNKKNVVIIGASTSLYSYSANTYYPGSGSYVDLLKAKFNVLNLSSHDLYFDIHAQLLIDFAKNKISKIDYVVLENLRFMRHQEYIEDSLDLAFALYNICRKNFNNSENCKYIKNNVKTVFRFDSLFTHPCLKRYQSKLSFSLFQSRKERVDVLSDVLMCRHDFFDGDKVVDELIERYHYAHLQDLQDSFKNVGIDLYSLNNLHIIEEYGPADLLLLNFYLQKIMDKNNPLKIVVIPNFSKRLKDLDKLPVFKNNLNGPLLIDISSELSNIMNLKNLKHSDLFPDGAHAQALVHKILADKILSELF